MIEAKDLMIGDWILWHNMPIKVTANDLVMISNGSVNCEPIPITIEILEKNGFELRPDGWLWCKEEIEDQNYIFIQFRKGCDGIRNCELNFIHSVRATFKQICYIHQLQHALRLCGIDKNITV